MSTIENISEYEDEDYNLKDIYLLKYIEKYPNFIYNVINNNDIPSNEELIKIFQSLNNNSQEEEDSLTVLNDKRRFELDVTASHKDSDTKSQSSSSANPIFFNIINQRARGRESLKQRKDKHLSSHFDNLQTKIQVHFLTFIIKLSNDVLKKEFGNKTPYNFKQIDYKFKKVVNHKNVQKLKNSTIKELLKMKISPKNKKYTSLNNNITLDEVCKKSKFLNKFFDMKYLEVFSRFYYSEDKLIDTIDFEGEQIMLSTKTETFYNLLKKYEGLKSLLIDTVKSVYFNGYDKLIGNNSFKIFKNEEGIISLKE